MKKVLWIIGAGASYHLGMPLLNGFLAFFEELWNKFPENKEDPELSATLPQSIELLRQYPDGNIEGLLSDKSLLSIDEKTILKRAIRRSFERRNLGRIQKVFGKKGKLAAYSYLLCLIEPNDTVVSFNYDNALETLLSLVHKDSDILNESELDNAQKSYLHDGKAEQRWIPDDCISCLHDTSLQYVPQEVFTDCSPKIVGTESSAISLIKIHGSVNWFLNRDFIRVGDANNQYSPSLIVYPEASKPELLNMPHRMLVEEANKALSNTDIVVIIGYSFPPSDAEGHPFVSELAKSLPNKKLIVVDPYPSSNIKELVSENDILVDTFENVVLPYPSDSTGKSKLQKELERRKSNQIENDHQGLLRLDWIEKCAYFIWRSEGGVHGKALDHWIQAEQQYDEQLF